MEALFQPPSLAKPNWLLYVTSLSKYEPLIHKLKTSKNNKIIQTGVYSYLHSLRIYLSFNFPNRSCVIFKILLGYWKRWHIKSFQNFDFTLKFFQYKYVLLPWSTFYIFQIILGPRLTSYSKWQLRSNLEVTK